MEEKKFRTKTGFCHIQNDEIILTRDGIIGNVAKVIVGNKISPMLLIYGILSIVLLFSAFESFQEGKILEPILFLIFGVYLIYGMLTSLNNSATPVIDRKSIQKVKFKKAIFGLTRSRFEVFFMNENGKIKKRLIMLPGSLSGGHNETKVALQIMRNENLLKS